MKFVPARVSCRHENSHVKGLIVELSLTEFLGAWVKVG